MRGFSSSHGQEAEQAVSFARHVDIRARLAERPWCPVAGRRGDISGRTCVLSSVILISRPTALAARMRVSSCTVAALGVKDPNDLDLVVEALLAQQVVEPGTAVLYWAWTCFHSFAHLIRDTPAMREAMTFY